MKNENYTLVLKTAYLSQTGGIVIVNFCPTNLMEFNGAGDGIEPPSPELVSVCFPSHHPALWSYISKKTALLWSIP